MPRPRAVSARPFLLFAFVVATLAFTASARAEDLRGRVTDPQGRPVANAEVLVLKGARVVLTARTTADGRFGPLALPPGEYALVVSAPGLRSEPRRITITPSAAALDVDVRLALAAVRESVVVSAAQVETALSRVTESVTVIDRAEILERQSETIADAIRRVPGFTVVASGGRGAVTSFLPRGGESDYTLVIADGMPLNAFGGGFDAAHLSIADVERIEVVRGPQSALFGGGAIGGVVHVITRLGGPLHAEGAVETGGYGTSRLAAGSSGSRGDWTWGATIDWTGSDGDTREFDSVGGRVSNDDYERVAASARLGWSDRADRRVRVDVRLSRDERGTPGPFGSDPMGFYGGLDTVSRGRNDTRAIGARAAFGSGRGLRHSLQAVWTDSPSRYASPFGDSEDQTRRLIGRYQLDLDRRMVGISAGWEGLAERADNTFITDDAFEKIPVERSLNGWFVETRWPIRGRGAIHAGARLERIARTALAGDAFGRPGFETDVVWSANPKISAAWYAQQGERAWTRVRMGAGTGIKPPTAFEIAFTDNPSLQPERSRSIDVGIEHARRGGAVVVDATWFANRYDHLIVAVGSSLSGASRYRTDNIANARARGLELGATWRASRGLVARAGWTWMDTAVLAVDSLPGHAPAPFAVGDPLLRRATHQGSAEVAWSGARAGAIVAVNGRGRVADFEPNFAGSVFQNPGFATVMLGGSVKLATGVEVYGRVTNLFDRSYRRSARLSGARSRGHGGSPRCSRPLTSGSATPAPQGRASRIRDPRGRLSSTASHSASDGAKSSASLARTAPARPRCSA